jgi:transposase
VPIPVRLVLKKNGGPGEQALGRSRGGFSTKIHITVDGLGNPLRLRLTGGERHDITQAAALIDGLPFEHVIADRGYAAQDFIAMVIESGAEPVIPPKQNAKQPHQYDSWLYRERHLVECFVNKIKHFRRVFSRFDKLATRYLGFLQFVSTLIWLR